MVKFDRSEEGKTKPNSKKVAAIRVTTNGVDNTEGDAGGESLRVNNNNLSSF
jgi:hypothetical protein